VVLFGVVLFYLVGAWLFYVTVIRATETPEISPVRRLVVASVVAAVWPAVVVMSGGIWVVDHL
jgi:hypothetical protein